VTPTDWIDAIAGFSLLPLGLLIAIAVRRPGQPLFPWKAAASGTSDPGIFVIRGDRWVVRGKK
jgi:hypothetical protein